MNMRVTAQTQMNNAVINLRKQQADAVKYQDQISTGTRVKAASDKPADFVAIQQARAFGRRTGTYSETLSDATSDLNGGVEVLTESNRLLSKGQQLAAQAANGPSSDAEYEAYATEVESLLKQMIDLGNRQNGSKYLFGGTAEDTPPFQIATTGPTGQPTSIAYNGAPERAGGRIGQTQTVETKYVGAEVFLASGANAFESLIKLRDNLSDNTLAPATKSRALNDRIADLSASSSRISEVIGEQSASLAGMEAVQSRLTDLRLTADSRAGELEGTDYAEAVVKLKEQESAFQATLSVTSRLLQSSLLDFIR
jgi:flagellar hook-associated protein 3 FlgL